MWAHLQPHPGAAQHMSIMRCFGSWWQHKISLLFHFTKNDFFWAVDAWTSVQHATTSKEALCGFQIDGAPMSLEFDLLLCENRAPLSTPEWWQTWWWNNLWGKFLQNCSFVIKKISKMCFKGPVKTSMTKSSSSHSILFWDCFIKWLQLHLAAKTTCALQSIQN